MRIETFNCKRQSKNIVTNRDFCFLYPLFPYNKKYRRNTYEDFRKHSLVDFRWS